MLQRLRPDGAELSPAPLLVRCLGALRLYDDRGNDLTPRTRKSRALLAYLAITRRSASRARLADLLWSDRGEEQAKSSLRQALFELRHIDDAGVLAEPTRDDIEIYTQRATTDLGLIEEAASCDDHQLLQSMLGSADVGLLTDLDGLDPEFDTWLRSERASQPSRALAAALESATRIRESLGAKPAQAIVGEILRLDPCSEEAARLAMQIDHAAGDMASLHRHFDLLSEHLRDDCGAEPSAETQTLFARLSNGTPKVDAAADGAHSTSTADPAAATARSGHRFGRAAIAGPLVVAAALVGSVFWQRGTAPPQTPLIAVLPWAPPGSGTDFLAQGIWEDTRVALSEHGVVRVLGRVTTEALAGAKASPQDYRRKLGVDYILEGSVQQDGEQVRVTVGLTRTADGISIWNAAFKGRIGDPAALQGAVAQGIEGQLRGRLAPGGGRMPDQIATTSEVYALYSRARLLLRERDRENAGTAAQLLRRATALDPNFAPAWASLASAIYFGKYGPEGQDQDTKEAKAYVRRALMLAPNLAQAHSTLALVTGIGSPESEQALKRALQLDPNNAETLNWLANTRASQYRRREAVALYEKALSIDPLFRPAAENIAEVATALGDTAAVDRTIAKVTRAEGAPEDILALRAMATAYGGDISAALGPLLALRPSLPGKEFRSAKGEVGILLIQLGYGEEAARLWGHPNWFGPALRSEVIPPDKIAGQHVSSRDFWSTAHFPIFTSRAMLNLGKSKDVVTKYRQAFRSRDEFAFEMMANDILPQIGPNVAVALQQAGEEVEARLLLGAVENLVQDHLRNAPGDRELFWEMARIRAAQGRHDAALDLLRQVVARGWLPDGIWYPNDIAQEPVFWGLRRDPRFDSVRRQILARIAKERAELGPVRM